MTEKQGNYINMQVKCELLCTWRLRKIKSRLITTRFWILQLSICLESFSLFSPCSIIFWLIQWFWILNKRLKGTGNSHPKHHFLWFSLYKIHVSYSGIKKQDRALRTSVLHQFSSGLYSSKSSYTKLDKIQETIFRIVLQINSNLSA